jgi:hypothetical protein
MTHKDAGKYALKHPGKNLDEKIASRIKEKSADNTISCAKAHGIAGELGIAPIDVGTTSDLLEVRLNNCQLGLYGHGDQKKVASVIAKGNEEIRQAIKTGLINGRLPCAAAWEIARRFGVAKIEIASECDSMKIKINSCQLGAFKS